MSVRNWLYNKEIYAVFVPPQRTISVGNITVGGTGKTPMIELLAGKLRTGISGNDPQPVLAILSRGYGRRTKGFRLAGPKDTAETIGDEPLQLYQKFGGSIVVAVAERRALGLQEIARQYPSVEIVLLDDAFQHRAVRPHLNILLTDYNRPFYNDHPFPAGRLREQRKGARRADMIIVTKCPTQLSLSAQQAIVDRIMPYKAAQTPVFFAGLRYGNPANSAGVPFRDRERQQVVLVSGLANADPLEAYVKKHYQLIRHHRYNDHYVYKPYDIELIMGNLPTDVVMLTTEKDWVKIEPLLRTEQDRRRVYYLPIQVVLLNRETDFWRYITQAAFPKKS